MPPPRLVRLANGIALDVWEEGPADAPALIFLHGFPESLRAWRHQIAHLSPRFRCIAPDQRGYGRSSRPAGVADYALPLLAGDIIALADALGLPRFGLIAHDWGAMVAWALAHRHPARLTHLAIANGPHPAIFQRRLWCDDAQRRASQYIRALRDPAADVLIAQQGLGALLAQHFDASAFKAMERPEIAALFARWAEPGAALAMLNWYRAAPVDVPELDSPLALPADGQAPVIAPLPFAVQIIWGLEDAALPSGNYEGLADFCPELTITPIAGAGHFTPWQAPAEVNAALDAFLG